MERYLMDTWPGQDSLEDVITWGIEPLFKLNELIDHINEQGAEDEKLMFLCYDQKSKLMSLKEALYRYEIYIRMLESRLREVAPDDSLITDPVKQVKKDIQHREKLKAERLAERGKIKVEEDFEIIKKAALHQKSNRKFINSSQTL